MMAGRPKRTELDKIKARAWAHCAFKTTKESTWESAAEKLNIDYNFFQKISRGMRSPANQLFLAKEIAHVFKKGPEGTELWAAMDGKLTEFPENMESSLNLNAFAAAIHDSVVINQQLLVSPQLHAMVNEQVVRLGLYVEQELANSGVSLECIFQYLPESISLIETLKTFRESGEWHYTPAEINNEVDLMCLDA